jgi:transposase
VPKPYPIEFRRDVVAVARKGEAPVAQIAKDFGISEATLHNWLKKADIEDGIVPGTTEKEAKPAHPDRIWDNTDRPSSGLKTINPENQQKPGTVPQFLATFCAAILVITAIRVGLKSRQASVTCERSILPV